MPTDSCFHSPFELVIELEYITGKPGFIFYNVMLDLWKKKKKYLRMHMWNAWILLHNPWDGKKINAVKLV